MSDRVQKIEFIPGDLFLLYKNFDIISDWARGPKLIVSCEIISAGLHDVKLLIIIADERPRSRVVIMRRNSNYEHNDQLEFIFRHEECVCQVTKAHDELIRPGALFWFRRFVSPNIRMLIEVSKTEESEKIMWRYIVAYDDEVTLDTVTQDRALITYNALFNES